MLLLLAAVGLSGCISHPDMAYMQDPTFLEPYLNYRTEKYLVREYDNLIIRINSMDPEVSAVMNQAQADVRLRTRGVCCTSLATPWRRMVLFCSPYWAPL